MNRDQKGKFKVQFFREVWRKRNGIAFATVVIIALWPTVWSITTTLVEFPNVTWAKESIVEVEQTLQEELNQKAQERFEKNIERYKEDARLEVMLEHNNDFQAVLEDSMQNLSASSTE